MAQTHARIKNTKGHNKIRYKGERIHIRVHKKGRDIKKRVDKLAHKKAEIGPSDKIIGAGHKIIKPLHKTQTPRPGQEILDDVFKDLGIAQSPTGLLFEIFHQVFRGHAKNKGHVHIKGFPPLHVKLQGRGEILGHRIFIKPPRHPEGQPFVKQHLSRSTSSSHWCSCLRRCIHKK